MSVATATDAVSTQQHRPTPEQIRLAQLIEDKKHDQPEVEEIIRKVLDVVEDSNQEDALVALFDCDYDYERTVALLIEKGHEVASEWRTATSHKLSKKHQQKFATSKNGHGELDENGQQRRNDTFTSRGKSRGGRSNFQQNGDDSQNVNNQQKNNHNIPQHRQRGGNAKRGRKRDRMRGGYRGNDGYYQQLPDLNVDTSSTSDTNRRTRDTAVASSQQHDTWDIDNWDGKTRIIYSSTTRDDEQPLISDNLSETPANQSNRSNQEEIKAEFDPIEAARQIKNVIGIGQTSKTLVSDQQQKMKTTGQTLNTKATPPLPHRIPQQPVVFTDHFDGGINKIDVQFGSLGEPFDETSQTLLPPPPPSSSSSSSSKFYQQSGTILSNKVPQRTMEPTSNSSSSSSRPSEQSAANQQQHQRILPTQIQPQPTIPIKSVVTPQYAVHQQQHQINASNILLQSLLFQQQQQQPESVTLDTSYDPSTFALSSIDLNSPYFMAAAINQSGQQQAPPRYLVSQPLTVTSSKNPQTPPSVSASGTTTKKAPAIPPGMFPTAPPINPAAFTTTYGVQHQTTVANFSTPYENEHLFTNTFMPLASTQQIQSPTGTYGSVTPPVQQQQNQQQLTNNNNDNKTMNYPPLLTENLMLLQQFQQVNLQQSNNQQQGQQTTTHSPAAFSYFLGHPPSGPNYSAGPPIMYAPATTAMPQHQQGSKQQAQQYNQKNSSTSIQANDAYYGHSSSSSSSNKEGQYMYPRSNQPQHVSSQSVAQQQNVNKPQQQQQRTSGNIYNNRQGQQRSFQ